VIVVLPPAWKVLGEAEIVVVAADGVLTVTVAEPERSPCVAVIVAVPSATAVTTPAASTVATLALLVPHVTDWSAGRSPTWSRTVLLNVVVWPAE